MLERWTGEVIGTMHIYGIEHRELAKQMGVTPQYLSMVLNGKKHSACMEFKARRALNELLTKEAVECPG